MGPAHRPGSKPRNADPHTTNYTERHGRGAPTAVGGLNRGPRTHTSTDLVGWVCFGFSLILGYNLVKGSSPSIRAPGPFLREIGGLVIPHPFRCSKLKER